MRNKITFTIGALSVLAFSLSSSPVSAATTSHIHLKPFTASMGMECSANGTTMVCKWT